MFHVFLYKRFLLYVNANYLWMHVYAYLFYFCVIYLFLYLPYY